MRRRLGHALATLAFLPIVAAVAMALLLSADSASGQFLRDQQLTLGQIADGVAAASTPGELAQLRRALDALHHEQGHRITLDTPGRAAVDIGPPLDPEVHDKVLARLALTRGLPDPPHVMPFAPRFVTVGMSTRTPSGELSHIVLTSPTDATRSRLLVTWTMLGLCGALAWALLTVSARAMTTRWLVRPLRELEQDVTQIARGGGSRTGHLERGETVHELASLTYAVRRLEDRVMALSESHEALIADTAHRLRSPLTALTIRLDSVADQVSGWRAHELAAASEEATRLSRYLDQMLHLAGAVAKAAGDDRCVPLDIVRQRIDFWSPQFVAHEIAFECELVPAALEGEHVVAISELDFTEIVDALFSNVVTHAGPTQVLTRYEADSTAVLLTVRDAGRGVAPEFLPRVSDRFVQERDREGSGLGLSLVRAHTERTGGTVTFAHTRPHGLTVRVLLPVVASSSGVTDLRGGQ